MRISAQYRQLLVEVQEDHDVFPSLPGRAECGCNSETNQHSLSYHLFGVETLLLCIGGMHHGLVTQARSVALSYNVVPAATGKKSKKIRSQSRVRHLLVELGCQQPVRTLQPLCGQHLSVTASYDSTCLTAPSSCFCNTWDHLYVRYVKLFPTSKSVGVFVALPRSPCLVRRLLGAFLRALVR